LTSLESKLQTLIEFLKDFEIPFKLNERMERYSTIKIGGKAKIIVFPSDLHKLLALTRHLKEQKLKSYILSGGSNTLFVLDKNDSVIICTKNLRGVKFCEHCLTAYSGESIGNLVKQSTLKGLSGLEYYVGVPAFFGGALFMNFSCYNRQICDLLKEVAVLKEGAIARFNKEQLKYSYRNGGFERQDIILFATMQLENMDVKQIAKTKSKCFENRVKAQPLNYPSLGCVYKNQKDLKIGKLIDDFGLKGLRVGGAKISEKHGAFIVNENKATANDVLNLIDKTKEIVYNNVKIELETEIVILH